MASRLVADRDRHAGQIVRLLDGRLGRDEDARRCDRVGVGVEFAVTGRRRHVHGPVTGGAHVALAPSLDRLVGAHPVAEVLLLRVLGADRGAEFVLEAFLREVPLLLSDPLLQSEVRRDDERGHGRLPPAGAFTRDSTLFLAGALSPSGLLPRAFGSGIE